MNYNLTNDYLKLSVKEEGAEICSLKSAKNNIEYIWQADPEVWGHHSPILFPIVGALKDGKYIFNGKDYYLPQHGFVRQNKEVKLYKSTGKSLCFSLKSNDETLKNYPFEFELFITYSLNGNKLEIEFKVINPSDNILYFSVGAHPAFRCPLNGTEKYSDYYLEFSNNEMAKTYAIASGGLIDNKTKTIFDENNTIDLHEDIFSEGALVFKDLKSKKIHLRSKKTKQKITVSYNGFPYMGIWSKPKADFLCIEPWLGIADSIDANQNLIDKEGIIKLEGKSEFVASYSIEILE